MLLSVTLEGLFLLWASAFPGGFSLAGGGRIGSGQTSSDSVAQQVCQVLPSSRPPPALVVRGRVWAASTGGQTATDAEPSICEPRRGEHRLGEVGGVVCQPLPPQVRRAEQGGSQGGLSPWCGQTRGPCRQTAARSFAPASRRHTATRSSEPSEALCPLSSAPLAH